MRDANIGSLFKPRVHSYVQYDFEKMVTGHYEPINVDKNSKEEDEDHDESDQGFDEEDSLEEKKEETKENYILS